MKCTPVQKLRPLTMLLQYDGTSAWAADQIRGHDTQAITHQMYPLVQRGHRVCGHFGLRCPIPAHTSHTTVGKPTSR